MDKAWAAGIPHITFTGGEPTLRDDLPVLIAHAEKIGQVTGLLTDGMKLTNKEYLNSLLQTGLDHLLFILQPDNPASWEALQIILPEDLFTTVHLTVTPQNSRDARETLERLARSAGEKSLTGCIRAVTARIAACPAQPGRQPGPDSSAGICLFPTRPKIRFTTKPSRMKSLPVQVKPGFTWNRMVMFSQTRGRRTRSWAIS